LINRVLQTGAIGIILLCVLYAQLQAQGSKSVWDGVYTTQQAARGAALYAEDCASCHADDLLGSGPMPALTGKEFRKEWDGQSVGDLFERMSTSMPADRPGKLSKDVDADILAFILKSNDFPAGQAELKSSVPELHQIRFLSAKPL
jgi:S-disulfanyl-L-cysteine oxidoreductase SoxD